MSSTRAFVFGEVKRPCYAENFYVCRGKGIEPLNAEEDVCKQGGLTMRTGQG